MMADRGGVSFPQSELNWRIFTREALGKVVVGSLKSKSGDPRTNPQGKEKNACRALAILPNVQHSEHLTEHSKLCRSSESLMAPQQKA